MLARLVAGLNVMCIYINEDGSLGYILSGEAMEDTHVQKITYTILPEDKRDLSMVKETHYVEITKEVFLKELENLDRRFDSLSYRIEELQSDEELQELARKMRKQNSSRVMATVSLEDYKK